jgi:Rieske Fe-S protein
MPATSPCIACIGRRSVLAAGLGGLGGVVTGCASYGDPPVSDAGGAPAPAATDGGTAPAPAAPAAPADPTGPPIATLADVPVGGGVVLEDERIVLTRPTDGEVRAFSATCTHAGCLVDDVREGGITCPCHGSVFDVATGAPTAGPATRLLPPVPVAVSGSEIRLA